eukprot:scaffold8635_cov74-Skeletonema_menzelii.AAC.1
MESYCMPTILYAIFESFVQVNHLHAICTLWGTNHLFRQLFMLLSRLAAAKQMHFMTIESSKLRPILAKISSEEAG